jgi:hypothetical protein
MSKITYIEEIKDTCKVGIHCKCGQDYIIVVKSGETLKCKCGAVYKAFYTGWIISASILKTETGKVTQLDDDSETPF